MITRLSPIEFHRAVSTGKTRPSLLICETIDGQTVEVIAKFSAGCEQGATSLAREVIAAGLAADLGLPIPEPFLVTASLEWVHTVPDQTRRALMLESSPIAFGSKLVQPQFAVWGQGQRISDAMMPTAAAILAFDGFTQNPDRRAENPNCLVRGDEVRIFDHEFAFSHGIVLAWKPPWVLGGLSELERPGAHIFRGGLRRREIDFGVIRMAWAALSDQQIADYARALPPEWANLDPAVESALTLIRQLRDNIDACLAELKRVLT
jgi:hypothetical protein